jgi:hypothetical protein
LSARIAGAHEHALPAVHVVAEAVEKRLTRPAIKRADIMMRFVLMHFICMSDFFK